MQTQRTLSSFVDEFLLALSYGKVGMMCLFALRSINFLCCIRPFKAGVVQKSNP